MSEAAAARPAPRPAPPPPPPPRAGARARAERTEGGGRRRRRARRGAGPGWGCAGTAARLPAPAGRRPAGSQPCPPLPGSRPGRFCLLGSALAPASSRVRPSAAPRPCQAASAPRTLPCPHRCRHLGFAHPSSPRSCSGPCTTPHPPACSLKIKPWERFFHRCRKCYLITTGHLTGSPSGVCRWRRPASRASLASLSLGGRSRLGRVVPPLGTFRGPKPAAGRRPAAPGEKCGCWAGLGNQPCQDQGQRQRQGTSEALHPSNAIPKCVLSGSWYLASF